jgi:serine/threonine protein kinase
MIQGPPSDSGRSQTNSSDETDPIPPRVGARPMPVENETKPLDDLTLTYLLIRPGETADRLGPDGRDSRHTEFAPGLVLQGRYTLERELGRGGMGQVYLGRDTRLDRLVAIKVILPDAAGRRGGDTEGQLRLRFADEARLGANLAHPAIATVFDYGFHEGHPFTVFEYIPGETLGDLLRRRGRLPLGEARLILGPLAQALDFAHSRHIVHRDLKPENIRATEQSQFKILDLGLAREFLRYSDWSGFAGTPAYAAPEQAAGLPCDGRADQYALALIAFELLTGRRPFEDRDWRGLLEKHRHVEPPSPRTLQPDLPDAVCEALARAMQKGPNLRHPSCEAFAMAMGCQFLTSPAASAEVLLEGGIGLVLVRMGLSGRQSIPVIAWRARLALTPDTLLVAISGSILHIPVSSIIGVSSRERGQRLRLETESSPSAAGWRIGFRSHSTKECHEWRDRIQGLLTSSRLKKAKTGDHPRFEPIPLLDQRPDARFQVIGRIEVRSARPSEAWNRLQILAASRGAQSVIDVRDERLDGHDRTERRLSGVAIRSVDPEGLLELNRRAFTGGVLKMTAWSVRCVVAFALVVFMVMAFGTMIRVDVWTRAARRIGEELPGPSLSEFRDYGLIVLIILACPLGLMGLLRWLRWPQLVLPIGVAALGMIGSLAFLLAGLDLGMARIFAIQGNHPAQRLGIGIILVATVAAGGLFLVLGIGFVAKNLMLSRFFRDEARRRNPSLRRVVGLLVWVASAIYMAAAAGGMAWVGYSVPARGAGDVYLDGASRSADAHFLNAQTKLLRDPGGAELEFRKALAHWGSLAKACPHTPTHQDAAWANVAITYDNLAEIQLKGARLAEADQSLRAAVTIDEKLVSEHPDRPIYRHHLEGFKGRLDWLVSLRDRRPAPDPVPGRPPSEERQLGPR